MTTASQVIDSTVLRDTLLSIEPTPGVFPIRDLVPLAGATGQYKVYWQHVPDEIENPYITLHHMFGGRGTGIPSSHTYSDSTWKVVGHTGSMETALAFANAISLLDTMCPVTTSYSGMTPLSYIEEMLPMFDRYQVQNNVLFVVGGLYRLRLNLGEN